LPYISSVSTQFHFKTWYHLCGFDLTFCHLDGGPARWFTDFSSIIYIDFLENFKKIWGQVSVYGRTVIFTRNKGHTPHIFDRLISAFSTLPSFSSLALVFSSVGVPESISSWFLKRKPSFLAWSMTNPLPWHVKFYLETCI